MDSRDGMGIGKFCGDGDEEKIMGTWGNGKNPWQ